MSYQKENTLPVPSKGGERNLENEEEKELKAKKIKDDKIAEEMSSEDKALKEALELAVTRILENDQEVSKLALETIKREMREATSSMTSVPKPIKFLRHHYNELKQYFETIPDSPIKREIADVLSVLAITIPNESNQCLHFKKLGNATDFDAWGHEYVRSLSAEVAKESNRRLLADPTESTEDLIIFVDAILPYHFQHNSEAEAIDLLMEVNCLDKLLQTDLVDRRNYHRVALYLLRCADFMSTFEELTEILNVAYELYLRQSEFSDALRVALRIGDSSLIDRIYEQCTDEAILKQLCFILWRHQSNYEVTDSSQADIVSGSMLSERYLDLARELDTLAPKVPEDIYKTHLIDSNTRSLTTAQPDSARQNLAATIVNAFVNVGYTEDKLMTEDGSNWIYKNRDYGMLIASASLGMIHLWNVENGLTKIDRYLYTDDENIKAGALLASGIVNAGVKNECDPALALLTEYVEGTNNLHQLSAVLGLGLAYAGSQRQDIMDIILPVVNYSQNASMHCSSIAGLSLGMIFIGSCNDDVCGAIAQRLMESSDPELSDTMTRFLVLGLALLFFGKQDACEAIVEAMKTIEHPISKYAEMTIEACAYAGTGNVLQIQKYLHICAEHLTEEQALHQAAAVLGIALVAMGEEVGSAMAERTFGHLLQYGELPIRRTVALGLSLMNLGNPQSHLIDNLQKLTHDADAAVSQAAIISLGLIGSGTNNSRIAGLLRQLSSFYQKDHDHLFVVRIAQGLLHMGKGLVTINPYHSDRFLFSHVAMSGILTFMHACIDIKSTLLSSHPYLCFTLATAITPRMLMTLDEDLNPINVSVRVGQAVDTVGMAGNPRTITGFQTHSSPVLLGYKDRAELSSEEYIPLSKTLDGFVILRKNPDFDPEHH